MTIADSGPPPPQIVVVPRPRYDRTIKLLLAITATLATVSLTAQTLYLGPTAKSSSETVEKLAESTAVEKRQNACYDLYSSDVTDGNADALAALVEGQGAIGQLVVALRAQDQKAIDDFVAQVAATAKNAVEASAAYKAAIAARNQYAAAGRPLPCTNSPN